MPAALAFSERKVGISRGTFQAVTGGETVAEDEDGRRFGERAVTMRAKTEKTG